jgi:DNA-directed RNA polymerase sigma subunit (sigma70/sigma32)
LDAPLKEDSDTERIEFMSTESESAEETVAKKEMSSLLNQKIAEFRTQMTDRELEILISGYFPTRRLRFRKLEINMVYPVNG